MPQPSQKQAIMERLRADGVIGGGTQGAIRASMQSTFNNLRAPLTPYGGDVMQAGIPEPAAPAQPSFGGSMSRAQTQATAALPASVEAAGTLSRLGDAGQLADFQQRLRGLNLNPEGQAPGDFQNALGAARAAYDQTFGSPQVPVAPTPFQTFAPTGLRQAAIAGPAIGEGGAIASATPQAAPTFANPGVGGGYNFVLRQNPATVAGGPGYSPVQQTNRPPTPFESRLPASGPSLAAMDYLRTGVAPVLEEQTAQPPKSVVNAQAAPKQQSAYEKAEAQYKQATGAQQQTYTAKDGTIFVRDTNGRLQNAGTDPDIAAQAKAKVEAAGEEAKQGVQAAYKLMDEVASDADSAQALVSNIRRVKDLYSEGATSGFGQEALTTMGAALSRITGKEYKVSTQQELEKILGQVSLEQTRNLAKGGGSISNYERELFTNAQANKTLTPQANTQILQALENVQQRRISLHNERVRLEGLGLPAAQIAKELRTMKTQMVKEADDRYNGTQGGSKQVGKYSVSVIQ